MERKEMIRTRWKPYMEIDYQDEGMKLPANCLLTAIDFDAEILTLTPINSFYEQTEFPANLKYCSIPKRLKVDAINGKKVKDTAANNLKAKKVGDYYDNDDNDEDDDFDKAS